jgi:response regulator RpfG family c-di-GMP phosphodiesterase
MLTGKACIESAMKAVNEGEIFRFFLKPCDALDLKLSIRHGMEKYDLEERNRRLLSTIKVQSDELSRLEKQHPGITQIEEDENGAVIMPELGSDELASIMEWCKKEK